MYKWIFFFACGVTSAAAATIETSGGFVQYQSSYVNSVNIMAEADGPPPHHPNGITVSALFIDDYTLTITGGSGQGSFEPCMYAGAYLIASEAVGTASFGNDTATNDYTYIAVATCQPTQGPVQYTPVPLIPFTYDVPQRFTISLQAQATEGGGRASLVGFKVLDAYGDLQDAQFTLDEVPEPSTWFLVGSGLILPLYLRKLRRK